MRQKSMELAASRDVPEVDGGERQTFIVCVDPIVSVAAGEDGAIGRERQLSDRPRARGLMSSFGGGGCFGASLGMRSCPVARSYSRTVPSVTAAASSLPSGEMATRRMSRPLTGNRLCSRPVASSQRRVEPLSAPINTLPRVTSVSRLAVASVLPSGENLKSLSSTQSPPTRRRRSVGALISHTSMNDSDFWVASSNRWTLVATIRPSDEMIGCVWISSLPWCDRRCSRPEVMSQR